MNTLKLSLEYQCYPIWNYDSFGELVDNDLPEELRNDTELDSILLKVQELFDNLYVDTPSEFSSHGFRSDTERRDFLSLLFSSVKILRERYGSDYEIVCNYNEDSFSEEN